MRRCWIGRSEEHTSELQSLRHLVCRLLLEKKNLCALPLAIHPARRTPCRPPHRRRRTPAPRVPFCSTRPFSQRSVSAFPTSFFFLRIRRPPRPTLFPYTPFSR